MKAFSTIDKVSITIADRDFRVLIVLTVLDLI